MTHISEVLLGMLVRDGMSAGSAGTDDAQGKGAGLPRVAKTDPLTAQAREGRGEPKGMKKRGAADDGARSQVAAATLGVQGVPACSGVSMKKWRTIRTRPLLMIMDCGA